MAGILGFLCGATVEALNAELTITVTFITEWTILGCFLLGVLFQREIRQLLREMLQKYRRDRISEVTRRDYSRERGRSVPGS